MKQDGKTRKGPTPDYEPKPPEGRTSISLTKLGIDLLKAGARRRKQPVSSYVEWLAREHAQDMPEDGVAA